MDVIARVSRQSEDLGMAVERPDVEQDGLDVGPDERGGDESEVMFIDEGEGLRSVIVDHTADESKCHKQGAKG